MAIDYTIKAYPTVYKGMRYRSRLEAKWSAFFDVLGWQFQYEPEDLGSWSPDFQLITAGGLHPVFIEVKPISAFDRPTADRMERAAAGRGQSNVLLVGIAPLLPASSAETPDDAIGIWESSGADVGWGTFISEPPSACECRFLPVSIAPTGSSAFDGKCDLFGYPHECGWLSGNARAHDRAPPWAWRKHTRRLPLMWAEACNAVQWHGRDAG